MTRGGRVPRRQRHHPDRLFPPTWPRPPAQWARDRSSPTCSRRPTAPARGKDRASDFPTPTSPRSPSIPRTRFDLRRDLRRHVRRTRDLFQVDRRRHELDRDRQRADQSERHPPGCRPSNATNVYCTAGSFVYKSTDGVAHWNPLSGGLPGTGRDHRQGPRDLTVGLNDNAATGRADPDLPHGRRRQYLDGGRPGPAADQRPGRRSQQPQHRLLRNHLGSLRRRSTRRRVQEPQRLGAAASATETERHSSSSFCIRPKLVIDPNDPHMTILRGLQLAETSAIVKIDRRRCDLQDDPGTGSQRPDDFAMACRHNAHRSADLRVHASIRESSRAPAARDSRAREPGAVPSHALGIDLENPATVYATTYDRPEGGDPAERPPPAAFIRQARHPTAARSSTSPYLGGVGNDVGPQASASTAPGTSSSATSRRPAYRHSRAAPTRRRGTRYEPRTSGIGTSPS